MSVSRKDLLEHRDQLFGNTVLHTAIDENNTVLALIHINDDASAADGKTIVNVKACENTPLVFALKKGNIAVAKALLAHPMIDINITDRRGLTALHWACMLRQDEIISKLLEKGADPFFKTERWVKNARLGEIAEYILPIDLYYRDVIVENFSHFHVAAETAAHIDKSQSRHRHKLFSKIFELYNDTFFNSYDDYINPFVDSKVLHIPGEMAYTDLIFHMREVCVNLGWQSDGAKFISLNDAGSSHKYFNQNFAAGMYDFCKYRNEIPVDKKLLDQMKQCKHDMDEVDLRTILRKVR